MWNKSIRLDIFEERLFTNRYFLEDILFKGGEVSINILNSRNTLFKN